MMSLSRLTRLAALAAALLVVVGTLPPAARAQEKPRPGGILTWFDYGDPGRLDVHAESPLVVQQATAGVYSGLLHYDPDEPSKVVGDLAERWTVSPDGKTYTFHLRKNVKWHDGQPFSSADVKASFDRVLNPDFKSPKCGASLKPIVASVEAVDANTVEFKLKFAAAPFLPSIASAWCRVAAKHILTKYGDLNAPEAQVGTGPFKFKKYERGSVIEWERNPNYFIPGLPYLDGVKQFILVGGPTQLAAAKASKIMLWDAWPPMRKTQADELARARTDVDIYQAPINTMFFIYLNSKKPPFDNPDLRRAVNLAIDRQELVAKSLEGAGVPCAILDPKLVGDFALPLDEVAKTPGCRQPKEQDITEARKLVEKHHPNGLDIEVAVRQVGNYVDRGQLVLAQLRKIGIRGTMKTHESAAAMRPSGRATSRSSPPRTARWTSTSPRASSTSPTPRSRVATTGSTPMPRWTSSPTARSRKPTGTGASSSTGSCSATSWPKATTPPSRWAGWKAGSSRTRSSAGTSPASAPTTTTPS
jgi:peptide/nickel transport system substrate-binding protein